MTLHDMVKKASVENWTAIFIAHYIYVGLLLNIFLVNEECVGGFWILYLWQWGIFNGSAQREHHCI